MSIESGSTTLNHKAVAGADSRFGKRPGRADASGADGAGGFSMMMGLLSAVDGSTDGDSGGTTLTSAGEVPLPAQMAPVWPMVNAQVYEENQPPALYHQVFDAMKFMSDEGAGSMLVGAAADQTTPAFTTPLPPLNSPIAASGIPPQLAVPAQLAVPVQAAVPAQPAVSVTTQAGGAASLAIAPASAEAVIVAAKAGVATESVRPQTPRAAMTVATVWVTDSQPQVAGSGAVGTLELQAGVPAAGATTSTGVRLATHTAGVRSGSLLNPSQATETRESRVALTVPQPQVTADVNPSLVAGVVGDGMVRAWDRSGSKLAGGRSGTGFDVAMGATVGVNSRADAPYQIEASAAAVPDTAIAETVSYWVTHGVQNAELTLEGLGEDAVEVSISLQGDQALVDFRTDQPDIRRALEAANAQLRELLSSQGLQLAGMTIGSSGRRDAPDDGHQPRQQAKLVANQAEPVVGGVVSRNVNPSVGRSLDVFV